MRRVLVLAAATGLLGVASAGESQKAVPGGDPEPAKAAEAKKKDAGAKAEGARSRPPAPKGDAPEKPKPCEPVRPCPIE